MTFTLRKNRRKAAGVEPAISRLIGGGLATTLRPSTFQSEQHLKFFSVDEASDLNTCSWNFLLSWIFYHRATHLLRDVIYNAKLRIKV